MCSDFFRTMFFDHFFFTQKKYRRTFFSAEKIENSRKIKDVEKSKKMKHREQIENFDYFDHIIRSENFSLKLFLRKTSQADKGPSIYYVINGGR